MKRPICKGNQAVACLPLGLGQRWNRDGVEYKQTDDEVDGQASDVISHWTDPVTSRSGEAHHVPIWRLTAWVTIPVPQYA